MKRFRDDGLEAVVGRLYEAALDPSLWSTVLDEVSDALGAESAALFGNPMTTNIGIYHSPGAQGAFEWLAGEGREVHNPRPERAMRMGRPGRALTESQLFSTWELKNIPFNVALSKVGLHWEAGGVFGEINGAPLFMTIQRHAGYEGFGRRELEAMEALFPHFARAAQIASRLSHARTDGMLDAFEHMGCSGLLIDGLGRVVRMNRSAEALLGSSLDVRAGRLSARDARADGGLQRLIGAAVAGGLIKRQPVSASAPLPRPFGRPLAVYAMPLVGEATDLFQRARAILVIVDPDARRDIHSVLLAQTYNLTPAELRLALSLAKGKDLGEIADEHRVSQHTARTQLKALMHKTDTRRQSELVALLTKFAFSPAPPPVR